MSIAACFAADKHSTFEAPAASSLAHKQTAGKVTVAVDPYVEGEKVKTAFGKLVPNNYGVLPVLVVIQNDSDQPLRLDKMRAEYVSPNGDRVPATPASDVKFLRGPRKPSMVGGPAGKVLNAKKNPLEAWEIEGRAFAAQMVPSGNTASGFLYFQTGLQHGATLYLSGMVEAQTGKELLYFEIPIE